MPAKTQWMIYGANGYTGRLIAEEAARRGLRPILAGRNRAAMERLAGELTCPARVFELGETERTRANLADCKLVLNCAGPFSATALPLIAGAIAARAHYLDITGEIACLETAHSRHEEAVAAGVALIPAVGFDVVPSDCLAAQVASRVEAPIRLELAIRVGKKLSPGTAKTMLQMMPDGGRARIDGRIERVPTAWKVREIPFSSGPRTAMTIPWGDVSTAYYSTGIPNIETYMALSPKRIRWAKRLSSLVPLARLGVVRRWLNRQIERRLPGPTEEQRRQGRGEMWACVTGRDGAAAEATLETPEGYALTVQTALAAVERLLAQPPPPGFHTPSRAFGADFIEQFDGARLAFRGGAA